MSRLVRAIPVALLIVSGGLGATQLPGPAFGPGFQWDQLAPQLWQPNAKVLTASAEMGVAQA